MAGSDTASDLIKQYISQLLCETHLRMTPTDLSLRFRRIFQK